VTRAFGCSREVLLVGGFAIKVPQVRYRWRNFVNGLLHNMNERERWMWTRDPRLCPVIWGCPLGFVLVMRRADVLNDALPTPHILCDLHPGRARGRPHPPDECHTVTLEQIPLVREKRPNRQHHRRSAACAPAKPQPVSQLRPEGKDISIGDAVVGQVENRGGSIGARRSRLDQGS